MIAAVAAPSLLAAPDSPEQASTQTEPVVMWGRDFADWSARSNFNAKVPGTDLRDCPPNVRDASQIPEEIRERFPEAGKDCHNHYADPELETGDRAGTGTPIDRLVAYRYDERSGRFVQIPFQVDEVFTRYLDNSASGFAFYSGQDQHTTYAFDREGWRHTASDPADPCKAVPAEDPAADAPKPGGPKTTPDPVAGLDDDDEIVFMTRDTGPKAPESAKLPRGVEEAREVVVANTAERSAPGYVYVVKAGEEGPAPAFGADDGYVSYRRDPGAADMFERSISSYEGYGNAAVGPYCDREGKVVGTDKRRPRDYATIETPRYRFRYDGRWLMTDLRISPDDRPGSYGPDLVDRWKARAFQQDPSSDTPCCGYEEEDTNWGGSSTLLGERVGPVRAIRETWGADSGTNVVRRETFYRDEVRQKSWLRVHPIPPLDGIYAQWDFNAGHMTRYYTPKKPEGVPVDGRNDEAMGNFDDPCNEKYDDPPQDGERPQNTSEIDQGYRQAYRGFPGLCEGAFGQEDFKWPYHQSIDVTDPSLHEANGTLQWNVTAGPSGTIVDRWQLDKVTDVTPGGTPQTLVAMPYYRDDSCFDDGTGTDPGPKINLRSGNEPETASDGSKRQCWRPGATHPLGSDHYYQGSIATHGLHILLVAESDNARLTVPTTEIVGQLRMVMLPSERGADAGERYGRGAENPVLAAAVPFSREAEEGPDSGGGGARPPDGGEGGGRPPDGRGAPPAGDQGGSAARPRSGPRPRRRRAFAARVRMGRKVDARRGRFKVRCGGRGLRACAVTVRGRLPGSRRTRRLGAGRARAREGVAYVTVRLSPAARRALRRRPSGIRAKLVARMVRSDGARASATRRFRLRGR